MPKFNAYFSPDAGKIGYSTPSSKIKKFDDDLYYDNNGTITVDSSQIVSIPSTVWDDESLTQEYSSIKQKLINDDNYYQSWLSALNGKSLEMKPIVKFYKRGLFVNPDDINNSYYPLSPILVGDEYDVLAKKISTQTQLVPDMYDFSIYNWYSQTVENPQYRKLEIAGPNSILSSFSSYWDTYDMKRMYSDSVSEISKKFKPGVSSRSIDALKNVINQYVTTTDPKALQPIYYSIVNRVTDNSVVVLVSLSPLTFVPIELPDYNYDFIKNKEQFYMYRTTSNTKYYAYSNESILVIKYSEKWKPYFEDDTYDFQGLNLEWNYTNNVFDDATLKDVNNKLQDKVAKLNTVRALSETDHLIRFSENWSYDWDKYGCTPSNIPLLFDTPKDGWNSPNLVKTTVPYDVHIGTGQRMRVHINNSNKSLDFTHVLDQGFIKVGAVVSEINLFVRNGQDNQWRYNSIGMLDDYMQAHKDTINIIINNSRLNVLNRNLSLDFLEDGKYTFFAYCQLAGKANDDGMTFRGNKSLALHHKYNGDHYKDNKENYSYYSVRGSSTDGKIMKSWVMPPIVFDANNGIMNTSAPVFGNHNDIKVFSLDSCRNNTFSSPRAYQTLFGFTSAYKQFEPTAGYCITDIIHQYLNVVPNWQLPRIADNDYIMQIDNQPLYIPSSGQETRVSKFNFMTQANSDDAPYLVKAPITNKMYYDLEDNNATEKDIILSSDFDDIMNQSFDSDNLYDDLSYNIISLGTTNKSALMHSSSLETDKVFNEILPGIKVEENLTDKQYDKLVNNIKDSLSNYDSEVNIQLDKYQDFAKVLVSYSDTQSVTELIGLIRIMQTNIDELPEDLKYMLEDLQISDQEIRNYANTLSSVVSSTIGATVEEIVDTIDINNEITLINSLVGEHVTQLSNSITELTEKLNDVEDKLGDNVQTTAQLINQIQDTTRGIANSISNASEKLEESLNDIISSEFSTGYDKSLVNRNKTKTIGYTKQFLSALIDDPYSALSDHVAYMKQRVNKASAKLTVYQGMLNIVDRIPQIPNMLVKGFDAISNVILSIITMVLNTAVETVTIIDNIDKINFISEQFITKRNQFSTDNPSSVDDLFDRPSMIGAGDYPDYSNQLILNLSKDNNSQYQLDKVVQDFYDNIFVNGYNDASGNKITVDQWNFSDLFDTTSGYLLPFNSTTKKINIDLPIVVTNSQKGLSLKPNLYNFKVEYPHRGHIRKIFLTQIANFSRKYNINISGLNDVSIDVLSNYMPITPDIIGVYSGFIIAAAGIATAAAVVGAGLRGDLIGMIAGGVAAAATVSAANIAELVFITKRRTYVGSNQSVYDVLKKINDEKISFDVNTLDFSNDYILCGSNFADPLYVDASDLKKLGLYVKEIMFLLGNVATMITASFIIGRIAAKITNSAKRFKVMAAKKRQVRNSKKELKANFEKVESQLDQEINKINTDDSLTPDKKQEKLQELQDQKENLRKALNSNLAMLPKNKEELWNVIKRDKGYSGNIPMSAAATTVMNNAGAIGQKTFELLNKTVEEIQDYYKNPEIDSSNPSSPNKTDNISTVITSLSGITETLIKKMDVIEEDTKTIKKYT